MIVSCNLLLTAELSEAEPGEITIQLQDARHSSVGYTNEVQMSEEFRTVIGAKVITLGLQALLDKLRGVGKPEPEVEFPQKGASA
jgi:hypothetical protein